jgi:membrane protease YdiL (CAAX protease family)
LTGRDTGPLGSQPPDIQPITPDEPTIHVGERPPDANVDRTPGAERPPAGPPGLSTFSLEGRAAPALYLIGWIGSLTGVGIIGIALLAAGTVAAALLFLIGLLLLSVGLLAAGGSQAVERARRPDLAYRGPSPVLAFFTVFAITLALFIVVLAPLSALGLDPTAPISTTVSLLLTAFVYAAVIRLLVVGPGALSWADMGLRVPARAASADVAVGALLAVPVLVVTLLLSGLLSTFLQPSPSPLPSSVDAVGLVANLLSAAIIAPISEELFFRGFATTAWAKALGPRVAIVRGALFFSFAHVIAQLDPSFAEGAQRALFSFVALLPVGLTLGWLFLARRSLYAPIGLHATFNAIQVLLAFAIAAGATG